MPKIKSYARRRLLKHLRNPPKICLCHKYETVDKIRLKMIDKLEDVEKEDGD